jgi:hypothetical protein
VEESAENFGIVDIVANCCVTQALVIPAKKMSSSIVTVAENRQLQRVEIEP